MADFFNIDGLAIGESVSLLVSATTPDETAGRWRKRTPVTVTRFHRDAFAYASEHGGSTAHAADYPPDSNVGHRGLYDHVKARGATLFEALPERELVARCYRAFRRKRIARHTAARTHGTGESAMAALRDARDAVNAGNIPLHASPIWSGSAGNGKPFAAYGESAMRWFEAEQTAALRFVGLAHDCTERLGHTGWYLDDFQSETVAGVVYQLPARDGRARFLFGYADPWNCDKAGHGPACLSSEIIEAETRESYRRTHTYGGSFYGYDSRVAADESKADAGRRADRIAELMAEAEREYQAAHASGRDAREKAAAAREIGRAWVKALRGIRTAFAERREAVGHDVPISATRAWLRSEIAAARELCADYREALETARDARNESMPGRYQPDARDAWREGYAEGVEL